MSKRTQNEHVFPNWEDLPGGGRRYWRGRIGGDYGWCRYIKTVDADEQAVRFVQEVYDDDGQLIEFHQKYPLDTGHQVLGDEE